MIFDGSTRSDSSPSDLDEELYITKFRISFRFTESLRSYDRLIPIINDDTDSANCINSEVNQQYIGLLKDGDNTWSIIQMIY